ncbi:MAG: FG-GAP-like repeat-containing protein [Pseudomonadota bacterium]
MASPQACTSLGRDAMRTKPILCLSIAGQSLVLCACGASQTASDDAASIDAAAAESSLDAPYDARAFDAGKPDSRTGGERVDARPEIDAASEAIEPLAGWPKSYTGFRNSAHPNVVDIDGDGKDEVLFAIDNRVFVLGHDGLDRQGWPQTPLDYQYNAHTPAVGDIDGDGDCEIVVCIDTSAGIPHSQLYAWHHDGTLLDGWPADLGRASVGELLLANIDTGSPGLETVVVSDPDDLQLNVVEHNGSNAPGWPAALPILADMVFGDYSNWHLAAGDVDSDGKTEIVVTTAYSRVGLPHYDPSPMYVYRYDGTPAGGWPQLLDGNQSPPILGNLDDQQDLEIIVGVKRETGGDQIRVFELDGKTVPGWPVAAGGAMLALADVDGNGQVEIVAFDSFSHYLQVLNKNAQTVWRLNLKAYGLPAVGRTSSSSVGMFFPTINSSLDAVNRRGTRLSGFPISLEKNAPGQPSLGDLDGDGNIDLVIMQGLNVLSYRLPYLEQDAVEWPLFQRDAVHSGVYVR